MNDLEKNVLQVVGESVAPPLTKVQCRSKRYRDKNKNKIVVYLRDYRESHRKEAIEYATKYRENNREMIRGKERLSYKQNPEKKKQSNKEWYYNNRERLIKKCSDRQRRKSKEMQSWWRTFRQSLKCSRCSESRSECLDFHHINPVEKVKTISAMALSGHYSIDKIIKEMGKCIVLCANCHRVEHANGK